MNSGKKPSGNVRKRPVTEPIIIEERVKSTPDNAAVTPLVVKKKKDGEYQCFKVVPVDLTKLDPRRKETDKMILLRLKSQHKAVTRLDIFTFFPNSSKILIFLFFIFKPSRFENKISEYCFIMINNRLISNYKIIIEDE